MFVIQLSMCTHTKNNLSLIRKRGNENELSLESPFVCTKCLKNRCVKHKPTLELIGYDDTPY
ncbi:MAG: hypothetical protein UY62_C0069G0010 [Parcubacteria group bacterium GW2011_GWF2_50_9]|nr:MAG: hypothetical protein UY62_C0069G0010 [Parcubacteria group bacterium GW2011_GWF2_50_9]